MREELRLATPEDQDLLFEWTNDKEVRENSFSTEKILYESHVQWFGELLDREECKQYIYCINGLAIGQVRVTIDGSEAEIGYSICASYRGMGYGKKMLQLLMQQIKHDAPEVKKLIARVKPENVASQKVFLRLGYEEKHSRYEIEI